MYLQVYVLPKDRPYLTLMSELWGILCMYLGEQENEYIPLGQEDLTRWPLVDVVIILNM